MVDCLLDVAGCRLEDIAHCYLSGAFSAHSNLESAITIGMFPDLDRKKYSAYPNTSLDGARTLLLDRTKLEELQMLMEHIFCFQFASIPDFFGADAGGEVLTPHRFGQISQHQSTAAGQLTE